VVTCTREGREISRELRKSPRGLRASPNGTQLKETFSAFLPRQREDTHEYTIGEVGA
jgi:hypothetical protein